nr:hypothetical protein [Tanacetum cinerariifolium]
MPALILAKSILIMFWRTSRNMTLVTRTRVLIWVVRQLKRLLVEVLKDYDQKNIMEELRLKIYKQNKSESVE